jgi:D-alanyl-D-alanine carboxypeptidase
VLTGVPALAIAAVVLATPAPVHAAAAPPKPPSTMAELREEVERTSVRLENATRTYEEGQAAFGLLVQGKVALGQKLESMQREVAEVESRVGSFASNLYRSPINPVVTAAMQGNFRAVTDYRKLTRGLNRSSSKAQRDLAVMTERIAQVNALLERQESETVAASRMQAKLDNQLAAIRADVQASSQRLLAAEAKLRREAAAREAAAAAAAAARAGQLAFAQGGLGGGATCLAQVPEDAVNGFLPIESLCPLATAPGHRLIASAAEAFDAMSQAMKAALGKPICVTDSYRDYAGQVSVFARKPNLAATPGRSVHGLGRALDLCGGIQRFGTPEFVWMTLNSTQFGFFHPDWAGVGGSKPEAWHWEFRG